MKTNFSANKLILKSCIFFSSQKLKDKYPDVVFAKVDVDDAEVSRKLNFL